MPEEQKLKLGQILVKEAFLTEEQLSELLAFQEEKGTYTPLGELCVAAGHISRRDLKILLKKYHKRMRIGEVLLTLGLITEKQLEEALALQQEKKVRLGEALVEMGFLTEHDLMEALSDHLDIPRIVPDPSLIDRSLLTGLSQKFLAAHNVLPVHREGAEVTVILADPLARDAIKHLEMHFKCRVAPAVATKEEIAQTIKTLAGGIELGKIELSREDADRTKDLVIKDMDVSADADRTVQVVNYLVTQAVRHGASDIHIEPQSARVQVRYRIDGILHKKTDLPAALGPSIASRIKALCDMDIAERRRHQDGRIEAKVLGKEVDLRISTYASTYGENVVIRILHRHTHLMGLEELGFSPINLARYERLLNYPSGIILVTGPTGSGKTTTLYASLHYLNNQEKMIITVEDPVEYTIDGVVQGKLDPKLGLSYSDFLKSMMRQDPDVIMVGEIRDADAAEATIQAALTGHKIFSSFHTDDTTGALLRLMDMGIDTFLISSTVVSIISQRLVRVVCKECREEYVPDRGLLASFQIDPAEAAAYTFYRGRGCKKCNDTGYKGRTAIHELLLVNDAIRDAILGRKTSSAIRSIARQDAELISMREDGIYKSAKGITNLEEVVRVVFHNESDRYTGKSIAEICDLCEMRKGVLEPFTRVRVFPAAEEGAEAGRVGVIAVGKEAEGGAPGDRPPPEAEMAGTPREISVPASFREPITVKMLGGDPSSLPKVEILRVRLKASEVQNEIDKIAATFNEYVGARRIFNQPTEWMEVEDFLEYVIAQVMRLRIRLNIEFVELVLRTGKDGVALSLETISGGPSRGILMMKSMPVIYDRLVEEMDFEGYLKGRAARHGALPLAEN